MQCGKPGRAVRADMRGVSLIEVVTVLAIVSVLLTLGLPAMWQTHAETRVATRAGDLVAALAMARSEAIRRGVRVSLCKTLDVAGDPPACSDDASWEQDWLLFVDNTHLPGNTLGVLDAEDRLLRVFPAYTGGSMTGGANFAAGVSYRPNGVSQGIKPGGVAGLANGTFTLCDRGLGGAVLVNVTGRVRVGDANCG